MGNETLVTALLIVAAVILIACFARGRARGGSGFRPVPVMTCAAVAPALRGFASRTQRAGHQRKAPLARGRDGFRPLPVSTCAPVGAGPLHPLPLFGHDDYNGVDMTGLRASPRDAAGTVAWDPYSTQSRVSLERYAETPEVATDLGPYLDAAGPSAGRMNPVTGLGRTSAVRAMGDRYRRNEALTGLSIYELGPGDPGYMEEVGDAHAMSLMAVVARRSPPVASAAPACLVAGDVDPDYFTDGLFNEAVILEPRAGSIREGLTSTLRSGTAPTTRPHGPRKRSQGAPFRTFEGPESRTPHGDASWAPGDRAGGPTTGAYASSLSAVPNNWLWHAVHGFGGGGGMRGRTYPEAAGTGPSSW